MLGLLYTVFPALFELPPASREVVETDRIALFSMLSADINQSNLFFSYFCTAQHPSCALAIAIENCIVLPDGPDAFFAGQNSLSSFTAHP